MREDLGRDRAREPKWEAAGQHAGAAFDAGRHEPSLGAAVLEHVRASSEFEGFGEIGKAPVEAPKDVRAWHVMSAGLDP